MNETFDIKEKNKYLLALAELSSDRFFKKLSAEEVFNIIKESISVGEKLADDIYNEFNERDTRKISERVGVRVLGSDNGGAKKSEYSAKEKNIIVYRDVVERINAEITTQALSDKILRILVGLELFSFFDEERFGFFYKKFQFKLFLNFKFQVKKISNVVAKAFVHKLLEIEMTDEVFANLIYLYHLKI